MFRFMTRRSNQQAGARTGRRRRRVVIAAALAVGLLATPIPWLLPQNDSWGMAWRLNGRLTVNGEVIDPPGRWTWLTAGRPPVLAEALLRGTDNTRDLRHAPAANRPEVNEPMAAAVGLLQAGHDIEFGLIVEATGPESAAYPERAVVVELNGIELNNHDDWWEAVSKPKSPVTFRTDDGRLYSAPGPGLPYERVYVIDEAPGDVEAAIGGRLATIPPFSWFRGLALGRSHGLVVALITYAHTVDHDLAAGRHVAATGGIRGDGTVTRIGGLPAKAEAARNAGVDVFLFPAVQAPELAYFDPGDMELAPVFTLTDAIDYLKGAEVDAIDNLMGTKAD